MSFHSECEVELRVVARAIRVEDTRLVGVIRCCEGKVT